MKNLIITFGILFFAGFYGCRDAEVQPKEYPFLITNEVSDISDSGVTFSAKIIPGTFKDNILACGFLWGNKGEIDISSSSPVDIKMNHFSIRVSFDLKENERYICRAYIITTRHTIHGNQVDFNRQGR